MLLYRSELVSRLRTRLDSDTSGRLVGGVFELDGQSTVISVAYLPSGLDHASDASVEARQAESIYDCVRRWSDKHDRSLLLGDLNETVADCDRSENVKSVRHRRFIANVLDAGFIDCYRLLHRRGGFTCTTPVPGRYASSRIDFILAKGWGLSPAHAAGVDDFLVLSRHQLLWADLSSDLGTTPQYRMEYPRLFNLRRATSSQIQAACQFTGRSVRRSS